MTNATDRAVVLLSGGIDSTTTLAIAAAEGFEPYALTFDYGQRHLKEIEAARRVAIHLRAKEHVVVKMDLRVWGGSALTDDIAVPKGRRIEEMAQEIPVTYVPARNTIFLSFALAWAEVLRASDLFIGVNAIDYSGYPDCRPEYIEAYERMASLATKAGVEGKQDLRIHTPLIKLSKAEIIRRGLEIGVDYKLTSSCYDPSTEGEACGICDSCTLRQKGILGERYRRSNKVPSPSSVLKMTYFVKEVYYTLQGEGANTGRPAVFCRFAGCNLWSGREEDRAGAVCRFCDTEFVGVDGPGGGAFSDAQFLADAIESRWPEKVLNASPRFAVCTGGEPLLQLDSELVEALHQRGFEVAVETNGTRMPPRGIDWICVSPKAGASLVLRQGNELKLVYPQPGIDPDRVLALDFQYFFLQPMDGPDAKENEQKAIRYCMTHPKWRLSLQTHKILGMR